MPNAVPTVSRRRVLIGTAALVLAGGALSACGSPPTRDPALDVVTGQLSRARSDSALAAAAAAAATPKLAPALTSVASLRDAHAQALSDELARLGGTPSSATPTTTPSAAGGAPAPASADVVAALQQSADAAAQVASGQSGYRAGLLASIAAACTAAATVTLAGAAA